MSSTILKTAMKFLLPLLILFSLFLFLRGHNEPGGGFEAGLVAGSAFALYSLANGPAATRKVFDVQPRVVAGIGLLIAFVSGIFSLFDNQPYLTGVWTTVRPFDVVDLYLGTPLLFDLGVFLVVTGVIMVIILTLEEVE